MNSLHIMQKKIANITTPTAENQKYFFIFNQWRRMDVFSTVFGLIGLVVGVLSYEYDVSRKEDLVFVSDKMRREETAMQGKRFNDPVTKLMRWITFGCSCMAVLFLCLRNHYKLMWINAYFNKSMRN